MISLATEKREALNEWKRRVGCADCGTRPERRRNIALVFHHNGEGKRHDVGSIGTRSWDRIVDEMAICDVLCYSCHTLRHQAR